MAGLLAAGPGKGTYNVSKHAQMAYGETLRAELADEGIGVSLLLPAGTESRILESARNRPPELGESSFGEEDLETILKYTGDELVSADHAVRNLVRGIRENAPWIVTHISAQRALIEERFRGIMAAFDAAED
jgi:NAD(P)-dependent dehydrogenase (short-subunit alcohol dehydrogenase family)